MSIGLLKDRLQLIASGILCDAEPVGGVFDRFAGSQSRGEFRLRSGQPEKAAQQRVGRFVVLLLVLLSQYVASFSNELMYLAEFTFQHVEGLRWVCQNQVRLHRGFRRMSRV